MSQFVRIGHFRIHRRQMQHPAEGIYAKLNTYLRDFETLDFRVAASQAMKKARLVSRPVGVDLRQHHRRRAIWAGHKVVRNLRCRLYRRHLLHHLLQAGAQPVSQPSTPSAEPLSMMLAMYASGRNDV